MMKLLILLACVAYAVADSTTCTPLRRLKVKTQWVQAYGSNAHKREKFGREVFDYLFEHSPKSRELFTRVRGDNLYAPEFDAHMVRVLGGFDICISLLDDDATLTAQLAHLNVQHKARNIPVEYFKLFEAALWHSIPLHAPHFDQDAWHACYEVISNNINKA